MATREEKLESLKKQEIEVNKKQQELHEERLRIDYEIEKLNAEFLAENSGLSRNELIRLRRTLTIIGQAVTSDNVIFANIQIIDEEPDITSGGYLGDHTNKYSIRVSCSFIEDYAPGLSYNISIKTTNDAVKTVIRSMITSNECLDDEEEKKPRNYWNTNWDYNYKITLKNPMDSDEFNTYETYRNP